MQFRTSFSISSQEPKVDYTSEIFLLGSCFVENIGEKLDFYKLANLRNPFGILYHPAAIENFVDRAVNIAEYGEGDVFHHNERWHCFEAHSIMSNPNREELVKNLNINLQFTRDFLEKASHVVITLGTSIGYLLKEEGSFVANCHKLPQRRFTKKLMEIPEINICLQNIIDALQAINPGVTVIFTVSPVRHLKEGVVENQQSKSHLIAAVHKVVKENSTVAKYFPAYEIVMDELRDYRFFAEDMIHPNQTAINYIWMRFTEAWLSKEAVVASKEVEVIQRGLNHQPFNPESEAHQKFLEDLQKKIDSVKEKYPHLRF